MLLREVIFIKGVKITKQKFVIYEITKQNCYSSGCVCYSLVSADSPGKSHLLFLPLENKIENDLLKHDINNIELDIFHNILLSALNECAPLKQKHIRANNGGFVTKELRKEIMKRTRLRNNFLKKKDDFSKALYIQ